MPLVSNNAFTLQHEPPSIVGMSCGKKESLDVYDSWAKDYSTDIHHWGYELPEKVAAVLKKYVPIKDNLQIIDVGSGDGLTGVSLREAGYSNDTTEIDGADLSEEMLQGAQQRGCYNNTMQIDLNKTPFAWFEANTFDALTCVGTMTYVKPQGGTLREFCRIVKPGGYVCYTNRTDKLDQFQPEESKMETEGLWKLVNRGATPVPYLPKNPDYGDKIQVVIMVFQKQ